MARRGDPPFALSPAVLMPHLPEPTWENTDRTSRDRNVQETSEGTSQSAFPSRPAQRRPAGCKIEVPGVVAAVVIGEIQEGTQTPEVREHALAIWGKDN